MAAQPLRRIRRRAATAALAALAVTAPPVGILGRTPADATGAAQPGDGTTAATAAASCYGILKAFPTSPSGTYWLQTPAMARPAAFRCDMTSAGGGWVLIARGREGWTFQPGGQGTAAQVRTSISGSAAFAPAALDRATITGLTNGADIAALSDGIRIERAANSAGTTFQSVRAFARFHTWSWEWPSGQLLSRIVIDGTSYTGGNTRDTYVSTYGQTANALAKVQGTKRMFTFRWANNENRQGFSYGRGVSGGSRSSTDHLWRASSAGYPVPFTRIWLRPRIANTVTGYPAIPAGGYPAQPEPYRLADRSQLAPWGVTGADHTGEELVEPWNANVLALKVLGDRVFVGGRFTGVQHGPSGPITAQASLAAFDLDGNWISTFRPVVKGRIFDVLPTTDGKLIVAGDFTSINGNANAAGIAALDPTTGAVVGTWKAKAANTAGYLRVRGLAQRGAWIYAVGVFDRLTGGTATTATTVSGAVSLSLANGSVGAWRPTLTGGSGVRVRVNQAGTRVLIAGHFTAVNGSAAMRSFAITDLATGRNSTGIGAWIPPAGANGVDYQQAVADLGDRVVVGGSQHDLQLWNPNRTSLLDSAIFKSGGDVQAIEVFDGKAFVGCHCGDAVYQGSNDYAKVTRFRSIETVNLVGMWDSATWTYDPSWVPSSLRGAAGEGIWAIDRDARGCLWVGGDLVRGAYSGNAATDYLGGFARFCPLDVTVPTTPGSAKLTSSGTARTLSWSASTDAGGGTPTYDVVRNDRVIATVSGLTYSDPSAPAGTRYTVRAVDARGNRSASPAPLTAP